VEDPSFLAAAPEPGQAGASAFVTVMKGCNERCSYCIVPYTRGPERYRASREIIDEVKRFVEAGVREVTLLMHAVSRPFPGRIDAEETRCMLGRMEAPEVVAVDVRRGGCDVGFVAREHLAFATRTTIAGRRATVHVTSRVERTAPAHRDRLAVELPAAGDWTVDVVYEGHRWGGPIPLHRAVVSVPE
jgi:hypothetical protein